MPLGVPLSKRHLAAPIWTWILAAYVASLPMLRPQLELGGVQVALPDLLLLMTMAAFALEAMLRKDAGGLGGEGYPDRALPVFLATSFAAYAAVCAVAAYRGGAVSAALPEAELMSAGVLTYLALRNESQTRRFGQAWLVGCVYALAVSGAGVLAFYLGARDPEKNPLINSYGTFAAGAHPGYPRLRGSFEFPNAACFYLVISFCVLCALRFSGRLGRGSFIALLIAVAGLSAFTLSPGLGGLVLAGGLLHGRFGSGARWLRRLAIAGGVAAAALMLVRAAAYAPGDSSWAAAAAHGKLVASPRVECLSAALSLARANPWLGAGLGVAVDCPPFLDPSGVEQRLTDAHDLYLNVLAHKGALGLVSLLALALACLWPRRHVSGEHWGVWRDCLSIAFAQGFFYQGLTGSFEHQRPLWVVGGALAALQTRRLPGVAEPIDGADVGPGQ